MSGRLDATAAGRRFVRTAQFELTPSSSIVELTTNALQPRRRLFVRVVRPDGATPPHPVVVGDENVSPTTGYVLYPLDELELSLVPGARVYATASLTGSQVAYIAVREEG